MTRAKLSLPRRATAPDVDTQNHGELDTQTIAAEYLRVHGVSYDDQAVANELSCDLEVAEELGACLMPRGQRFFVRRVLAHIAAHLKVDAAQLRDMLGCGDVNDNTLPPERGGRSVGDEAAPRQPKVVIVRRRTVNPNLRASLDAAANRQRLELCS